MPDEDDPDAVRPSSLGRARHDAHDGETMH